MGRAEAATGSSTPARTDWKERTPRRLGLEHPTQKPGPRPGATRILGGLKVVVGAIAWLLLLTLITLVAGGLLVMSLSVVILGSSPSGLSFAIAAVLLTLVGGLYWLLARFVSGEQTVRRIVGSTLAVLLFAGAVWAVSSPDRALFLARAGAWGDSDFLDWQKFPERVVGNAPPVFTFDSDPSPSLFENIEYTFEGRARTSSLDEFLESTNTTSFIVIKDDAILYEGYFNGYERDSIVTSFSIAKSITSALVGIAIDEGHIGSVDDPMVTYLPEMRGRGMDEMTIRDLLRMSSGIRFNHSDEMSVFQQLWPYQDEALSYEYPDMRDLALGLPASDEPAGAAFEYNEYHPLLLGLILERATGMSVSEYTQEKLWEPLGMQYGASWSLDSEGSGFEKMESGFNGRAIDFAKFGRLFLNNGDWEGEQIISEDWVRQSTAPDPTDDRPWLMAQEWKGAGGYYGYMWWGMRQPDGGYYYKASGHLSQRITVFPDDGLIIVRFGFDDAGPDDWDEFIASVADNVR